MSIDSWRKLRESYPELAAIALRAQTLPPLAPRFRPQAIDIEYNDVCADELGLNPDFEPDVMAFYAVTAGDCQLILVEFQGEVLLNRIPTVSVEPEWRSYASTH